MLSTTLRGSPWDKEKGSCQIFLVQCKEQAEGACAQGQGNAQKSVAGPASRFPGQGTTLGPGCGHDFPCQLNVWAAEGPGPWQEATPF